MTSGTAVLHHEAPPALPSPLQYPHHLLALLALLAADVLTTVWFTSLGLPELNPHIAPIAGSVAAQVAYKAPFALLLVAGTATLAASCDRLRPGAGRWPWAVVVGMYAIPVAWNLAAIQPVPAGAGAVAIVAVVAIARVRHRREVR